MFVKLNTLNQLMTFRVLFFWVQDYLQHGRHAVYNHVRLVSRMYAYQLMRHNLWVI